VSSIIECTWDFWDIGLHCKMVAVLLWSSVVCIIALQRRKSKLNEH
jgi:hypothetical protein